MGFQSFSGIGNLVRHLAQINPSVVHVHGIWNPANTLVMAICLRRRIPYVLSPAGMLMPGSRQRKALKKLLYWNAVERRGVQGASILVATSPSEAASIASTCKGASISVIPHAIDVPGFRVSYQERRNEVLFLGRFHPIKNIESLILAFGSAPLDWELVLAGDGEDSYRRRLVSLAGSVAPGRIRFAGWVDESERRTRLRSARALVLPSLTENFGKVALEALAEGTPVVASKGTPWETIESQGAGYWVEGTPERIREALAALLGSPAAWTRASRAAQELARTFSWETLWPMYEEMYEQAAGLRRVSRQ